MSALMAREAREAVDPSAFRQLAEAHYGPVYQFLARQVPNRVDAEDLTQNTFIEAYKSFARFDPDRDFAPWIFTIARRCLADFFRKPVRHADDLSPKLTDPDPDPGEAATRSEEADRLWDAARQLKPKYHQVLLLHYQEQFSVRDTARIMDLTVPHVKVLLFRARSLLKEQLEAPEKPGDLYS